MELEILGIRHHGPGSSRHLLKALTSFNPDIILVEGPFEANSLLSFVDEINLSPPVAIIVYEENNPQKAVFFPFTEYSPEYQAILYANKNKIVCRFADLPQAHQMLFEEDKNYYAEKKDPFQLLMAAAGFTDTERWWEHFIEKKTNSANLFSSLLEMMKEIRDFTPETDNSTLLREAFMRQSIYSAEKEGFQRVAFVCGAWHSPALITWKSNAKTDAQLLKKLSKIKTLSTWIPWTYQKMSLQTGYRAGINSPMWYEFIWHNAGRSAEIWMIEAANLLRKYGFDTSSSSVIEAVRLAETLSYMREMHFAGLDELKDAAKTVLCGGDEEPLALIEKELIVGEKIGAISEAIPLIPLQQDFYKTAKSLKIPLKATETVVQLDLRTDYHLLKSIFLHRLTLLSIPFAYYKQSYNKLGTFHEQWLVRWTSSSEIALIDANVWGNTVYSAAIARTIHDLKEVKSIALITETLSKIFLADLKELVSYALSALNNAAAMHNDIDELMIAVPPLVRILRYGDVRGTDSSALSLSLREIVGRVLIALPISFYRISDEQAAHYYIILEDFYQALLTLEDYLSDLYLVLKKISFNELTHPFLAGLTTRIIFDNEVVSKSDMLILVSYRLSLREQPHTNAQWLEGFIGRNAQILFYDDALWNLVNDWVQSLSQEDFHRLLPLFRRVFSKLDSNEKENLVRKLHETAISVPENTPLSPLEELLWAKAKIQLEKFLSKV